MKNLIFQWCAKSIAIAGIIFIFCFSAWSQDNQIIQDPAAGKILEKVAVKFKSLQSLQADFELVIEDRKEQTTNTSEGNLVMKQKKYRLNTQGSTVYFDGKTMWTHLAANNEVSVTEPESGNPDFLSNPSAFFDTYKETFKYKYVRQTAHHNVQCHEIDLFPKNLNQPYSRIKLFVNAETDLPVSISSIGKDGVNYTVSLSNLSVNKEFPDATFTFDPAKNKKVEVIDMRGL